MRSLFKPPLSGALIRYQGGELREPEGRGWREPVQSAALKDNFSPSGHRPCARIPSWHVQLANRHLIIERLDSVMLGP